MMLESHIFSEANHRGTAVVQLVLACMEVVCGLRFFLGAYWGSLHEALLLMVLYWGRGLGAML